MAIPPWAEISRILDQDGAEHYTGVVVYWAQNKETNALRTTLFGDRMKGTSGDFAPHCYRVNIEYGAFNDTRAKVTAYYRTRRQVGVAKVSILAEAKSDEVTRDLDGRIIVGPYISDSDPVGGHGLNYYKITRGSNVVDRGQVIILVEMAFERTGFNAQEINRLMSLQGRVNDRLLPNFGNFPKGTLKLMRFPFTNRTEEGLLWYADLAFAVSPIHPEPWNDWTKKQLHTKITQRAPYYDETGGVTSYFRDTEREVAKAFLVTSNGTVLDPAVGSRPIEPTRLHLEADFSDIDALINWSYDS